MRWRIAVLALSLSVACGLNWLPWRTLEAQEKTEAVEKKSGEKKAETKPAAESQPAPRAEQAPKAQPPAGNPPQQPPAVNPLQNLIQRLLPQPVPPPGVRPRPNQASPSDPNARDHIDSRLPKDRKQSEQLRKAQSAVESKDWNAALELLQLLLAQEEDSVERVGQEWRSVREQGMKLMLQLPEDVLRAFRQRMSADAARRLADAEESGRMDRLALVASRFLVLEAGQTAAQRMALRHLDRGEFARATRWFQWLEEAKAPITRTRSWQLQAALAAKQAGHKELAEKWLKGDARTEESSATGSGGNAASSDGNGAKDEEIEVGGVRIRVRDWWAAIPTRAAEQPALSEWPMFFGSPNRAALGVGGDPLLLPRWKSPLTQIEPLQRQIEMMIEDLRDRDRATISVCQPLLINGLVVMRTLSGVQVFDVATGRSLWSTAERMTAEDLLSNAPATRTYSSVGRVIRVVNGAIQYSYNSGQLENHPAAQLLFSNANFGVLSSDGRQLFAVEDDTFVSQQYYGYYGNGDLSSRDPLRRNWSSNKLVSYDLRDGRQLWVVGGVESDEPFQPELPGVFFFGAPVADGHELFVIGERDGEVRLFCLQADSGKPLWSQLLATAESTISRDGARRLFSAQVAIADGVILCPTTVGWLVAVDRASRQLLWTHRYSAPLNANQGRSPAQGMTTQLGWGMRWLPSAPVVVGNSVVYTPQEMLDEPSNQTAGVFCLDLHSGKRRWMTPKENWLVLNGVAKDKVLLLGQNAIGALALSDGHVTFNIPIPQSEGAPSGMGAIANDRWHVPLSSGQIWTISLQDGSRTGRQWAAPDTDLGNLLLYRGGVVSAHPTGLSCFEQRETIAEQIRQRKERDPADSWALLTEASILQLERKSEDAWKILQQVHGDALPSNLRTRYVDAMRDVLTAVIQAQPGQRVAELDTLERLLTGEDDRLLVKRLRVEQLRAQGQHLAAFELLLGLSQSEGGSALKFDGQPSLSVRRDAWVAGQVQDLWRSLSAESRSELDRRIVEEIRKAESAPDAERPRRLSLFTFHPASSAAVWRQIESAIAAKEVALAELGLLRIAEGHDPRAAARAWMRLVELYRSLGLPDDAIVAGRRLGRFGDTPLDEKTTARQWVESEVAAGRLARTVTSHAPDWSMLDFRLERSFGYHNATETIHECTLPDAHWPFFSSHRFQYQMMNSPVSMQRLAMSRLNDSQLDWSLPLRQKPTSSMGYGTAIRTVGHQMLIYHREVLHFLSPIDHRVVWTRAAESRSNNNLDPMQAAYRQQQPMQTGTEFLARPMVPLDEATRNAFLTVCTPEVVGYRGRRNLTVVDAATGEWRWEIRDLPQDAQMQSTNDLVFVTSARWPSGVLLNARDGRVLPMEPAVREHFLAAKASIGADLLAVTRGDANSIVVERWNPTTQQSIWKSTFPATSYFSWVDTKTLTTLTQDGTLATLDLDTHESRTIAKLPASDLSDNQRKYLVADHDRLFLTVAGNARASNTIYYGGEFTSLPVNGTLFTFDRNVGGELWRQKLDNQSLVLNHFETSPVLFFSNRKLERRGQVHLQVQQLLLLDKKTGRKLFDDELSNQYTGYRGLNLNLADREIELLTYNERLRLVGREPAKSESKTERSGD